MLGNLCDVSGLKVGHYTEQRRPTGCTVVLCEAGVTAGVDVRGAAPGTRETDLLRPENSVQQVHAVLLSGGSAFGLDAASGVMRWLRERGHGLRVGQALVPIVPAAVLFDLWRGDPTITPTSDEGYAACEAAQNGAFAQGRVGAGTGATVGKLFGLDRAMPGGMGSASIRVGDVTVGALVAVNAVGDVITPSGKIVAGARDDDGRPLNSVAALLTGKQAIRPLAGANTTLVVVATDAALDKAGCTKLAQISHDGLARTINPVHQPSDGDVVFALSAGTRAADLSLLGVMAAEAVAQAVLRAVAHTNHDDRRAAPGSA